MKILKYPYENIFYSAITQIKVYIMDLGKSLCASRTWEEEGLMQFRRERSFSSLPD